MYAVCVCVCCLSSLVWSLPKDARILATGGKCRPQVKIETQEEPHSAGKMLSAGTCPKLHTGKSWSRVGASGNQLSTRSSCWPARGPTPEGDSHNFTKRPTMEMVYSIWGGVCVWVCACVCGDRVMPAHLPVDPVLRLCDEQVHCSLDCNHITIKC